MQLADATSEAAAAIVKPSAPSETAPTLRAAGRISVFRTKLDDGAFGVAGIRHQGASRFEVTITDKLADGALIMLQAYHEDNTNAVAVVLADRIAKNSTFEVMGTYLSGKNAFISFMVWGKKDLTC